MAEGGRKVEDPRTAPVTTSAESKGGQKDADTSYPPEIVMELKRDFIFPVKDAQAQLLKECKVSNRDRQKKLLICAPCKKHVSSVKAARAHTETKEHKLKLKEHELERLLPALARDYAVEDVQVLTEFLTQTFQEHSAREQRESRFRVAEELQGHLKKDGVDVNVSVFGSSGSGFALKTSNLNLNISFSAPTDNPLVIACCMKGIAASLKNRGESYEGVKEDYFSFNKIPRIIFIHKQSMLECEVRIEAGNPAALCSLLKIYAEIDVRCVQLAVLFRLWARICGVDSQESGHYPGHMFVLMVIHFLQQLNVLPVLHQLYKNEKKKSKKEKSSAKRGSRTASPETNAATLQDSTKPGEDSSGRTDQEGIGEGEEDEDDIVVFAESETGGTGDDDDDETQRDTGEKVGERKQYEVDYLSHLNEVKNQWECTNHQSLGELWLRLLMYYAVDFKLQEHAVSIRTKQPLLRKARQWGDVRLAVEDPMIPKSNLGRASASNQVFSYLMGSLRLTALYFSVYCDQLSSATLGYSTPSQKTIKHEEKPSASICWNDVDCSGGTAPHVRHETTEVIRREGGEGLEGSTIEHQDSSILSVSSSVLVSTQPQEDMTSPVDLSFLNKQSPEASAQPAAGDLRDVRFGTDVVHEGAPQTIPSDNITSSTDCVSCELQGLAIAVEDQSPQTQEDMEKSSKAHSRSDIFSDPEPSISRKTLVFSKEGFVFQTYAVSCLHCKKLRHTILECPEFDLASKYKEMLPHEHPSSLVLKCISSCFTENMRTELLNEAEIQTRQDILRSILTDISELYPCAKLAMFGSSANGFGSKNSDLDICLTIPDQEKESRGEIIENIAKELKKKRSKYEQVFPITSARVPIVKFVMRNWVMQCDISLENKLALRNTKLLFAYTRIDRRVPELGCALKRLAKACDICDAASGSLSSYAYILMLLHYLQNVSPPVIPVLQQLKPAGVNTEGHVIDGWDCYYYEFNDDLEDVWRSYHTNTCTTAELWLGMLRYYTTEFDWNHNVVSMKQKEPLSKFDKWWMGKPMCIEDPFNLDHNLGGGISNRMRMYILDRFMDALNYHCSEQKWRNIRQLMNPEELKGGTRPPKFMRCHTCGSRGHKASECPQKGQLQPQPQHGSQQRSKKWENKEPMMPGTKTNARERVVYNVQTPRRKEKTPPGRGNKPHGMPQMYMNHSFIPNNAPLPPQHPLLLPTSGASVHQQHPIPPQRPFLFPQFPPGFHNFRADPGILQAPPPGTPPAFPLPYRQSNSYPSPYPQMVTRPRYVMPHTAMSGPLYRQQIAALFPHPPVATPTSIPQDPPSILQSVQTPGLPNRHLSAPSGFSTETCDSARIVQKGRRNRQKNTGHK